MTVIRNVVLATIRARQKMSESRVNNSRILPNTMQGAGTRVPRKRRLRVPSVADRKVNGAQALTINRVI